MIGINYMAVLVSAAAAFLVGGLWYSPQLFGKAYMSLRGIDAGGPAEAAMSPAEILGEFVRWLALALILARFMAALGVADLRGAMAFGAWMWLAIYIALAGSVLHESTPWRLYAIHAGDGLVKIALITAILVVWRAR